MSFLKTMLSGGMLSGSVGSLINLAGNAISSLFGNKQVDKQIKAQAAENQKTRQYNQQLAQQQNQWNIEQWERENAYNSPKAQMQRYMDAGLNPNLIYGQSNTAGQLSGSLTSGSPAISQDMSPMLGKKSLIASALQGLDPLTRAQVDNINADTEKKREETANTEVERYLNENRLDLQKWMTERNFMSSDSVEKLLSKGSDTPLSLSQWQYIAQFSKAQADGQFTRISSQEKKIITKRYDEHINAVIENLYQQGNAAMVGSYNDSLKKEAEIKKLSAEAQRELELLRQSKEQFPLILKQLTGNATSAEIKGNFAFWDKIASYGTLATGVISMIAGIFLKNAALVASGAATLSTTHTIDSDGNERIATTTTSRQ